MNLYNKILIPPEFIDFEVIDEILKFLALEAKDLENSPEILEYITIEASVIFELSIDETISLIQSHSLKKAQKHFYKDS